MILQTVMSGQPLPSAPLGLFISSYLLHANDVLVAGAVKGMNAGADLLLADQEKPTQSFTLLQELGTDLQVNVPDILNRSNNRQQTLDSYVDTLSNVFARSKTQLTALQQQQKVLSADRDTKRNTASQIQSDLNKALQKQDYATASSKQQALSDAKTAQSKAEEQVSEVQSLITIFTNLNNIADQRLKAIAANRQILIAGLQVINVPGINELNILNNGKGNSNQNTNPFGL